MTGSFPFSEFLKRKRLASGFKTQKQLADASGITTATLSRIESGIHLPTSETIAVLSNYLHDVTYEELMVAAGYMDKIMIDVIKKEFGPDYINDPRINAFPDLKPESKIQLYRDYRKLSSWKNLDVNSRSPIIKETKTEYHIEPYNPESMTRLPVLGSIRAGDPIDRIEFNEGYTLVDPETLRGREGFALRVKGDSMSGDRIMDGDIVIVVRQEEVQPSDIAVVAVNGNEATLKRVKIQGDMAMLIPSNPTYEAKLLPANGISVIGKVVEVKFFLK